MSIKYFNKYGVYQVCENCNNATDLVADSCKKCKASLIEEKRNYYLYTDNRVYKCNNFCLNYMNQYICSCNAPQYFYAIRLFQDRKKLQLKREVNITQDREYVSEYVDSLIECVNEFFSNETTNHLFDINDYIYQVVQNFEMCEYCSTRTFDFLTTKVDKFCYLWLWQYSVIKDAKLLPYQNKIIEKLIKVYNYTPEDIIENTNSLNEAIINIRNEHNCVFKF